MSADDHDKTLISTPAEPGPPGRPMPDRRPDLVLHIVGLTLAFCGAGMGVSGVVDALYGSVGGLVALLVPGLVAGVVGYGLWNWTKVPDRILPLNVFASVTAAWVTMSLVGMVPYLLTGVLPQLDRALFESISGFTTTGATVLPVSPTDPTRFDASNGLLFWRAATQWIGGMGVIMLVIAVLPAVGGWGMGLLQAEAPGPTGERLTPRVRSTARHLWGVYVVFTVVVVVAYLLAGMNAYDAITHALTTVSTGGFSPYTLSIAHFDSAVLEWIIIVAMFVAGTSFALIYRLARGKPGPLLRSIEFRVYLLFVLVATLACYAGAGPEHRTVDGFRGAIFSVVSVASTTGYGTVDFAGTWQPAAQAVLLVMMPIGAMAGSTAGGVKLVRVIAVASYAHRETLAQLHQNMVRPVRVGDTIIEAKVANQVNGFLILTLAAFGGSGLLIAFTGVDIITAFSASATTIGNVGPGLADVGPRSDFNTVNAFARMVAVVNMLLGRLEIYPILLALVKLPVPRLRPLLSRIFRA